MEFRLDFDEVAGLSAWLEGFADQIPYATSLALNGVAFDARRKLVKDLPSQFDVRNRYTQRGIRVDMSSKTRLEAGVGALGQTSKGTWAYMRLQALGGVRKPTGGAQHVAIPTEAYRDTLKGRITRRGDFPKRLLKRRKGPKASTRKGRGGPRIVRYLPGGPQTAYTLRKSVVVPKRWPLFKTTEQVVGSRWEYQAKRAMAKAIRTATRDARRRR